MPVQTRYPRTSSTTQEPIAQRIGGTAIERPRDETLHAVPLALRSAQHVFVSRGRFEPPWSKRLILIKWVIKGQCEMAVDGKRLTFGPRQAAVYLPTAPHRLWC
jgi:hypothetical protein